VIAVTGLSEYTYRKGVMKYQQFGVSSLRKFNLKGGEKNRANRKDIWIEGK
jgi:hypothetical protein